MPRYPTPIAAPIPAWDQQTLAYYAPQRLRRLAANSAAQLTMLSLQEAVGEELTGPKGIFGAHRNEAVSGGLCQWWLQAVWWSPVRLGKVGSF